MMNEPEALREIHNIRLQIFEETRGMTPQERADRTNGIARKLAQEFGLQFSYDDADITGNKQFISV